jgi:ABC-type nitrate/sulfonate/bicarbonate transport system permease component
MSDAAPNASPALSPPVKPSATGGGYASGASASDSGRLAAVMRLAPGILVPLGVLLGWQLYCSWANVDPTVLPSPTRIVSQLFEARQIAWENTEQTLKETVLGFSISVVVAILIATAMDQLAWLRRALYPMLIASQTIPVIAIAPLMIIWFGFGLLPKVLLIVLVTFFPIVVALLDGFAATEPEAMDLLRTMGAKRRQAFRLVRFPGALPHFFTGLRISATYAVLAAIFAEYVGAYQGLGIWMSQSKSSFRTDLVFGAIGICALISIALFMLIAILARLVIPWYYASKRAH